jgi:integrase
VKITKRVVDNLQAGQTAWDGELPGFGVRCQAKSKTYFVKVRVAGRQRWVTIGRHGVPWTPDDARRRALVILGTVAAGDDPREAASEQLVTVKQAAEVFFDQHVTAKRKPGTAALYRDLFDRLILPRLGSEPIRTVNTNAVRGLHHRLRSTPYQANRALAVLSKFMSFSEQHGWRDAGTNPCRFVEKYRERARERFLNGAELGRLSEAIAKLEQLGSVSAEAALAVRLLLLTGARLSEILTLRWDNYDDQRSMLMLSDSKTGKKAIPLNSPASSLLSAAPRIVGNPWVIVGLRPGAHLVNLQKPWRRIRAEAGLEDVRLHDLRHTYASVAASSGTSLPIIGKLLGHTQPSTTQRYAHLADDPVARASERTGALISEQFILPKRP